MQESSTQCHPEELVINLVNFLSILLLTHKKITDMLNNHYEPISIKDGSLQSSLSLHFLHFHKITPQNMQFLSLGCVVKIHINK